MTGRVAPGVSLINDERGFTMSKAEAAEFFIEAMEALNGGDTGTAMDLLEKAVSLERVPLYCSTLAFCLAKEKRDFKRAVSLCKEAIKNDPRDSKNFLHLGRVHLLAYQKKEAIRIFNMGLRYEDNREIVAELKKLGTRKEPVIPLLERENPINKYLGKLMRKQGDR
jgi:tetratricopeptide (TPR) repeat protein